MAAANTKAHAANFCLPRRVGAGVGILLRQQTDA